MWSRGSAVQEPHDYGVRWVRRKERPVQRPESRDRGRNVGLALRGRIAMSCLTLCHKESYGNTGTRGRSV